MLRIAIWAYMRFLELNSFAMPNYIQIKFNWKLVLWTSLKDFPGISSTHFHPQDQPRSATFLSPLSNYFLQLFPLCSFLPLLAGALHWMRIHWVPISDQINRNNWNKDILSMIPTPVHAALTMSISQSLSPMILNSSWEIYSKPKDKARQQWENVG